MLSRLSGTLGGFPSLRYIMSETIIHFRYRKQRAEALTDSSSGRHLAGYHREKEKPPKQYEGSIRLDKEAKAHDDQVQEAVRRTASPHMADDSPLQSPSLSSGLVTQKSSASSTSSPAILRCLHGV